MKTFKRVLALLLCAVMIFGSAPIGALVGLDFSGLFEIKASAATYSGTCGDNLTWTLDTNTGKLVISGTGAMTNWSTSSNVPWYSYRSYIKTVTIGNGITSIGPVAFCSCYNLESVTISDSVKSINRQAFSYCNRLTSVTIPDSVKNIDYMAFYESTNLKEVYYTGNFAEWCGMGFGDSSANPMYYADSLYIDGNLIYGDIVIPDSVTSIGEYVFCGFASLTSVTIPDSVTSIGEYAFLECASLTSVTIPDSVTSIGQCAFRDCYNLANVTIGNYVTSIGDLAFFNTALYNNELNWENDVLYIGKYLIEANYDISGAYTIKNDTVAIACDAFSFCMSLESVTIPDSVTSIGEDAFYCCVSLTDVYYTGDIAGWCKISFGVSDANPMFYADNLYIGGELLSGDIVIPEGVTSIGFSAFCNCDSLTSITIPDSVTSIGGNAFNNTAYYNNESNWENDVLYIGKHLIDAKSSISGEYTIKNGTLTIADYAFDSCGNLANITIPDSVTSIGEYAFYDCGSLTNLTLGDSVTSIGRGAFYFCVHLDNITISDNVQSIGDYAFAYCLSLKSVSIPCSAQSISDFAFYNCISLTSVSIPYSVKNIGKYTFYQCDSLVAVYYYGSMERWKQLSIDCFNEPFMNATVQYIEEVDASVKKVPIKTEYIYKKDNIDISGIVLEVTYADGNKKIIKNTSDMTVSGFSNEKKGEQTITVEFEGLKAEYKVTVKYAWWQWILVILLFGWIWY